MKKVLFSSDALPAQLDDAARFSAWHELFESLICCVDLSRLDNQPFFTRFEYAEVGGIRLSRQIGTTTRIARSRAAISKGPDDDFCFMLNQQPHQIHAAQNGNEAIVAPGAPVLLSNEEPTDIRSNAGLSWLAIAIERDRLRQVLKDAESLRATTLKANPRAVFLLERYIAAILEISDGDADGALRKHVGTTITDLVALALGAERDAAEIARMRGLRAARLQEILAQIRTRFLDPSFSSSEVARHLGVTPRYVNDLLQETGESLAERVLELRLQKALAMLTEARHNKLRVSEIAYACGFNEVSYFNRCFRRRFGASPTQFRADAQVSR